MTKLEVKDKLTLWINLSLTEYLYPKHASATIVVGRMVRWTWVIFQVSGRPTVSMLVGQGPTALEVGSVGGCLDIFTLIYTFFPLSPSLWETDRLKYCLKGPLNPKQPTNQLCHNTRHQHRHLLLQVQISI